LPPSGQIEDLEDIGRTSEPQHNVPPESINANATYAEKSAHCNSKANKTLNAKETAKIIEALEKLISRFDQQVKLNKMKFDMIEGELAKMHGKVNGEFY
ncbi:phage integrase family site specific recombinase, partial [Lasius niger]